VIYKTGIFQRHSMEMNRSKVETVGVDQSILGRILGYGTVMVRGTGGSFEPIRFIGDPLSFRSHITAGSMRRARVTAPPLRRSLDAPAAAGAGAALSIGLCAAIVAASVQEPRVL